MYFKKLEVFGFKSFADKTVLNFQPGITAIVGPNGCGKSNVFDSIRWVLGEQSAKQLRGSSMEDVIFNGTSSKPALGFAEVSVTFSNESKVLPYDTPEVTVTRRLFRSGESEYLINKKSARLKDITEMFMGTGVGADAYSFVPQGRVDMVVSAKPEERRAIFDEASGITKYKSKKKEALSKLKDTDNNLLRLNDIVVEVKRQIASIERQAKKAQRYKEEFEKLKQYEVIHAQYQISQFKDEKQQIDTLLADMSTKETDYQDELEELRTIVNRDTALLEELEDKLSDFREEELKLENEAEIAKRQIGFNEERMENLRNNTSRLDRQKQELVDKCRTQQEKIEELKRGLSEVSEAMETGLNRLAEKKSLLAEVVQSIEEAKSAIAQDEEKILSLTSRQVHIKNSLTENMKESQGALARRRRLEHEETKVSEERRTAENKLVRIEENLTSAESRVVEQQITLAKEKQQLAAYEESRENLDGRINSLEKKKLFLISQKEFVEKLQVQYQDIPDPVIEGRFLSTMPPTDKQRGFIGKVRGIVPVDFDRFHSLKSHLTNFEGGNLYEIICEAKYMELDPKDMDQKIASLEAELQDKYKELEAIVAQIQEQKKTIEGQVREIHESEKTISILQSQKQEVEHQLEKFADELSAIASETHEVGNALHALQLREDELANELDTANNELEWCQNNIKDEQTRIAERSKAREDVTVAIAQIETEVDSLRDKERGQQDNLSHFVGALDHDMNAIKKLDYENAEHSEKEIQIHQEIEELEQKIESVLRQKEAARASYQEFQSERDDVEQRLQSIQSHIHGIEKEITDSKDKLHRLQMKSQELGYKESSIKERLEQSYKINLDEITAARIEATCALPTSEEAEVADEVLEDGAASVDLPSEETKLPVAMAEQQPEINIEQLVDEIAVLKKRCDAFGSVNLAAIEELEEFKERFEFLTKQQSDLLTAKESLQQTITKINRTTKQLFIETFNRVSEEFRIYFRLLFGGGEADLIILDTDDVLESGIDIVARPPGKKLQNISLMSGGEKTMTAIALIFAVFKVNPSPFCVLDEIDAALDEANVGRFSTMLKEFAKIAQFIVVTHNKKTIASADILYGVTMQQTGVSRVVSVDLKDKTPVEAVEAHEIALVS